MIKGADITFVPVTNLPFHASPTFALTRASTIGPVAEVVERSGGSVSRVFRQATLPLALVDEPDRLILLRDQFQLIEAAAREIGDDALAARLSLAAGLEGLGPYGRLMLSFDRLGGAINTTTFKTCATLLQAATHMDLRKTGRTAQWTYWISEPISIGRQRNEILALGYMLTFFRHFFGKSWTPKRLVVPGQLQGRRQIEDLFASDIVSGPHAAVEFSDDLLDAPNPSMRRSAAAAVPDVPTPEDFVTIVAQMIALGFLQGGVSLDRVAARLSMSPRGLQRRLSETGTTFRRLGQDVAFAKASDLLRDGRVPISMIAYDLGYADPAHFVRAFRRWSDATPSAWRRQMRSKPHCIPSALK